MGSTVVTVCETCRLKEVATPDATGADVTADVPTHGARLHALVADALSQNNSVDVQSQRCLMACGRACTVSISAPGKMSYVLGGFRPVAEDVAAIVDYVGEYQRSETGVVPFRSWPQGIKGHFVARIPPIAGL